MAAIPGIESPRFYEKNWIVELIAVVPPIIAGAVTAVVNIGDPEKVVFGWILLVSVSWLGIASLFKVLNARAQDKKQEQERNHDGLLGALYTLYGVVAAHCDLEMNNSSSGKLRVTIHRVVPPSSPESDPEELEQILPYLGGQRKDMGRRFSIRSGIIGRAVRERQAFVASRRSDDHEAFIVEMVRDWAYTEREARSLKSDRQSWMAVPIFGDNSVIGVVYLDSDDHDFFGDDLKQVVLYACTGVSRYIDKRYRTV